MSTNLFFVLLLLLLFFINVNSHADSEIKYNIQKVENVDIDSDEHFKESKFLLEKMQEAKALEAKSIEKNEPNQVLIAKPEETKNATENLKQPEEKPKNKKEKVSAFDPFLEDLINEKVSNVATEEKINNNFSVEIANSAAYLPEEKTTPIKQKMAAKEIKYEQNKNAALDKNLYVEKIIARSLKKKSSLCQKALIKKLKYYNDNYKAIAAKENLNDNQVSSNFAKVNRFKSDAIEIRTSNIVNANQIVDNLKYQNFSLATKPNLSSEESMLEKLNKPAEPQEIKKNLEIKEAAASPAANNKPSAANKPNLTSQVRAYRYNHPSTKTQVIPQNILNSNKKDKSLQSYADLIKLAFDSVGSLNSIELIEYITNELPRDVKIVDKDGNNLVMHAVLKNDYNLLTYLIQHGFNANEKNKNGVSAVHVAASYADLKVMEIIALAKFDANQKNNDGNTPLMLAAATGNFEVVKILLDNGGNIYLQNNAELNTLDIAKLNNHNNLLIDVEKYLRR